MNILVTGAAGFIGSHLFNKLCNNKHTVVGIDSFTGDLSLKDIKESRVDNFLSKSGLFKKCDIFDEYLNTLFEQYKFDVVIHLAAHSGVRASLLAPEEYYRNNVLGTNHLLNLMVKHGCKNIVFASSSSVYGNCKDVEFKETAVGLKPISPYAATKLACEEMLFTYHNLYEMNVSCLRFFTVYGPEQRPDLAIHKFTNKILNKEVISVFGDGHNVRDYTYIDDIVNGIVSAINYTVYNKDVYDIFNLGGGDPISITEMIRVIACNLGEIPEVVHVSMQPGDVEKTVSNCDKAKELLGYSPKVSFNDGIKEFLKWKLKH